VIRLKFGRHVSMRKRTKKFGQVPDAGSGLEHVTINKRGEGIGHPAVEASRACHLNKHSRSGIHLGRSFSVSLLW
jgi:hypothetical protein